MKKMLAILCCATMLTMPAMAGRTEGSITPPDGTVNNYEYCIENPEKCQGGTKRHAKKGSDVTKIVVISVAAGAVFAGAMWYLFKKEPSENNPGQVKLASF